MAAKIAVICFGQYGPYHHARVKALQDLASSMGHTGEPSEKRYPPISVIPLQICAKSKTYGWSTSLTPCYGLQTLCEGSEEDVSPLHVFVAALLFFFAHKVRLAYLPSYSPLRYSALFLAAKLCGLRTVMMNETHEATARARGWKKEVKKFVIHQFDSALVGGKPQSSYFSGLGMPARKIFTGYDAIDNAFFDGRVSELRKSFKANQFGLPDRYILSLGRLVEKKNLSLLITAYKAYVDQANKALLSTIPLDLVVVGSGELECRLEDQARSLGLDVIDRRTQLMDPSSLSIGYSSNNNSLNTQPGSVYFYGFRDIDENPIFYAFADVFVLPSLHEEWGLVVNEAMACSLPVIVSQTAGCAADLVPECSPRREIFPGLRDCVNGLSFDPRSLPALSHAFSVIADSSPLDLQKKGNASYELISKFSCMNFARQALAAADAAYR